VVIHLLKISKTIAEVSIKQKSDTRNTIEKKDMQIVIDGLNKIGDNFIR